MALSVISARVDSSTLLSRFNRFCAASRISFLVQCSIKRTVGTCMCLTAPPPQKKKKPHFDCMCFCLSLYVMYTRCVHHMNFFQGYVWNLIALLSINMYFFPPFLLLTNVNKAGILHNDQCVTLIQPATMMNACPVMQHGFIHSYPLVLSLFQCMWTLFALW